MNNRNSKGIVLLGHPRSGTTLTRRLLNGHSRIASPPETHLLSACGRFLESGKTITGLDIGVLSGLNFAGINDDIVLGKLREFAFSFLDDFVVREGKHRWAEKTAFDAFHINNIERFVGNHALFVGIVRHPLDVALSCIKFCDSMGFYPKDMHKYIVDYPHPIEAFVHSWLDVSKDLISLSERHPDDCKIYRYEDLVSDTESTLFELLNFVGESFEEQILERGFSAEKKVGFGDHKSYQAKQVHSDSVGKWNSIPEYQIQKLAPLINPMLERLGYPAIELKEGITVSDARLQYSSSMNIVAQRGHTNKQEAPSNRQQIEQQESKTQSAQRISVYGNATTQRSKIFSVREYVPDEVTAQKLFELYGNPANCFNVVLLTLLHRIGEDNHLEIAFCNSNQDDKNIIPIKILPSEGTTFFDVMKTCEAISQEKSLERDISLLVDFDIVLSYFDDIELFNNALEAKKTSCSSNLDNAQTSHALSLLIFADKYKSSFKTVFNFNDSVWVNDNDKNRTLSHFKIILDAFADNVNQNIEKFSLLTKDEKYLLEGEQSFDVLPEPVIKQFVTQVAERAEHRAIVCGDKELSYKELGRRVAVLSALLRSNEVTQGKIVAVCLDRSINLVTALLAVMHAGGTYVPLDPDHPQSRISQILEDADPQFILSEEHLRNKLGDMSLGKTYILNDDLWEGNSDKDLELHQLSELAYIIFTSGSTGRPKGVEVYQNGLSTFLAAMGERPGMHKDDRLLSVTTVSFDIAALEIFLPLTLGATLFLARRQDTMNGIVLQELLSNNNITCFQATPATYHLLLANNWPGDPALKLLCGGEAMPPELAEELLHRCDSLWNMYGPTETTIWSTIKKIEKAQALMPIGKAIRGTRTYVLNDKLAQVPLGVAGELFIAGEGVAKGYRNREDQTKERFIPDVYSQKLNARMYRTGDLVKVLDDGELVYLGRLDNQVKIRGYRIELGDIEAAIKELDGIKQCVVGVFEINNRSKSLVAYIVALHHDNKIEITSLKEYLKPLIPEYMIPSFVVHLDEMPLTPNNKVDRKALPEPRTEVKEPSSIESSQAQYVNSKADICDDSIDISSIEKIIQSWQRILGIKNINPDDSFITLGGDSLSFVQITVELDEILGQLPDNWENKSVSELSTIKENSISDSLLTSTSTSVVTSSTATISNFKPPSALSSITSSIDATIFVRAFAILSVVFMHAFPHWAISGNTSVLFMVAGLLFSKFQLQQVFLSGSVKPVLISAWRIFLPSSLIMGTWLWWNDIYMLDILLLYSNLFGTYTHGTNYGYYWYIQVLLQILVIVVLLFAIRPIFQFAKSEPFKFGLAILGVTFFVFLILHRFVSDVWYLHQLPVVPLWYFMIGWCIYFSDTSFKRVAIGHVLGIFVLIYFFLLYRDVLSLAQPMLIFVCGVLLLSQSKIKLIKPLNQFCFALASSSLFVYLVHKAILLTVPKMLSIHDTADKFVAIGVSLIIGYIFWKTWEFLVHKIKRKNRYNDNS
jgi:amino acid adenylation domain-containing protein